MFTVNFWKDALERSVKTFVQFVLAQALAANVFGVDGVIDLSSVKQIGVAGLGAALSMLTSIVSAKVNEEGTASVVALSKPES